MVSSGASLDTKAIAGECALSAVQDATVALSGFTLPAETRARRVRDRVELAQAPAWPQLTDPNA